MAEATIVILVASAEFPYLADHRVQYRRIDPTGTRPFHEGNLVCWISDPNAIDLSELEEVVLKTCSEPPGGIVAAEDFVVFKTADKAAAQRYLIPRRAGKWRLEPFDRGWVLRTGEKEWRASSKATVRLIHRVAQYAGRGQNILIRGEVGSGKTSLAHYIHLMLNGPDAPLIRIGPEIVESSLMASSLFGHAKGAFTGAYNERIGLLTLAQGGTVLFEHVDAFSLEAQAALLSFLDDRVVRPVGHRTSVRVPCTVICTYTGDPEAAIAQGKLRRDFYARISQLRLDVPPLRERLDDIPWIVQACRVPVQPPESGKTARETKKAAESTCKATASQRSASGPDAEQDGASNRQDHRNRPRLTPEALERLKQERWPFNILELEYTIEDAIAMAEGDSIGADHIEAALQLRARPPSTPGIEEDYLKELLELISRGEDFPRARYLLDLIRLLRALRETRGNVSEAARREGVWRTHALRTLAKAGINPSKFSRDDDDG